MPCKYCELFENGEVISETSYWKYIHAEGKLFAVWYKHENLVTLSKCRRMAHDMQLRLSVEAAKFFGTNRFQITGELDTHVFYVAEKTV